MGITLVFKSLEPNFQKNSFILNSNCVHSKSLCVRCDSFHFAEAEYAFQRRKLIIPLKMQRGYEADGWLGFIVGTKLYYEFSGQYSFESRAQNLLKELKMKLKGSQPALADEVDVRDI